jgi:PIN domain nuclease of toxin-antitoxin system
MLRLANLQRESLLHVSVISIWEISLLLSRDKIALSSPLEHWLAESWAQDALSLVPLTQQIAIESTRLPGTIHRDPADRFLIATARVMGMTLLTQDQRILNYGFVSVEAI